MSSATNPLPDGEAIKEMLSLRPTTEQLQAFIKSLDRAAALRSTNRDKIQ